MVSVNTERDVAIITLDDGKANVLNSAVFTAIDAALDQAENSGATAIVLTGRPGYFCAGLDLKTLPMLEPTSLRSVLEQFADLMVRIFTCRRPVVAACTGHAIAGGMVTLLGADERYAANGPFRLGLNETAIGLRLPRFVVEMARCQLPSPSLQKVIVEGDLVGPEQACTLGLVDEVLAPEEVLSKAIARAQQLGQLPGKTYGENKMTVRHDYAAIGLAAYASELDGFMSAVSASSR